MSWKSRISALALALAVLGGGGLTATPSSAQTRTISGAFDVGPGGLQGNFNTLSATSGFTWLMNYFEPLVIYDDKLANVIGALAKSYQVSADQMSYTFNLVDTKWHDGQAFTSKDVAFTIALARNAKSGSVFAARLGNITAVENPDDHTVVIRLKEPTPNLLDSLTKLLMLPEHALAAIPPEQIAKNAWWSTAPVGTGPFRFVKYVTDQYVELAANQDFRDGRPAVDRLINRYFADAAAAISALRSGEIQFTYVEANDVPTFRDNRDYRIIEGGSFVVNYLGFNQEAGLWADLRVRQAVMYAIDREAIIKSLYRGAAKAANCVYADGRLVPADINPYSHDPAKARKLLAEAGWEKINGSKPITVLTYYNAPLTNNVLAAVQSMLAQVGINIVPRAVDTPTYNATVLKVPGNAQDYPLIFAGLQNGPDPSSINPGLNEKQIPPAGVNIARIKMPAVTQALDSALSQTDQAKSAAAYQEVCRATNANLPWATLWVANRYGVASNKLKDFVWMPAPGGGPYQAHPEKWSISQ